MSHLDEGMIHALLDGEIPSAELPPIQAHLGACAECRARLAEEQDLLEASDRLIEMIEVPEAASPVASKRSLSPSRAWPRNLAWAATLVLAAGIGYSVRDDRPAAPATIAVVPETTFIDRPAETAPLEEKAAAPVDRPQNAAGARERRSAEGASGRADQVARHPGRDLARAQETLDQVRVPDSLPSPKTATGSGVLAAAPPVTKIESLPAPPAAPAAVGRLSAANRFGATPPRLEEVIVTSTDERTANAKLATASPITLSDAIRKLGGSSLRLIEGLIPERLEAMGPAVRVIYLTGFGDLVLSQELMGGKVRLTLIAPRGFPADSLERLRARVRE